MEHKIYHGEIKKVTEKGEGEAIFATLNAIDSDQDVTLPGAFGEQDVQMLPAHNWTETPIGKAKILEQGDHGIANFKINLNNRLGKDWHATLKFDLDNPPARQQWSYGFEVLESDFGEFHDQRVRFLKKLKVYEISPVLVGAGVGTGTLRVKHQKEEKKTLEDQINGAIEEVKSIIGRVNEVHKIRTEEGRAISKERIKELLDLKASLTELDHLLEHIGNEKELQTVLEFHRLQNKILDFKKVLL